MELIKQYLKNNIFSIFLLSIVSVIVVLFAWRFVPHGLSCYDGGPFFLNCDFSLWYQASLGFPVAFKYGNILVHRPFFAFVEYLIYKPTWYVWLRLNPYISELEVFVYTWRLQNIFFYFAQVFFAYEVGRRIWSKNTGFYMAFLVSISPHNYAWLMQPLNNVQGFFVTFFSWWAVTDWYLEKNSKRKIIKIFIYSLAIGVLMLGKAMYNIPLTILVTGLLIQVNKKDLFLSMLLQALPTVVWIMLVEIVLKTDFKNYEDRFGIFYFIEQYYGSNFSFIEILNKTSKIFYYYLQIAIEGVGWLPTVLGLIYLGYERNKKLVLAYVIYLLATLGLLFASSFLLIRHAPDLWPLLYAGSAFWLSNLTKLFSKKHENFIKTLVICLLMFTTIVSSYPQEVIANLKIF